MSYVWLSNMGEINAYYFIDKCFSYEKPDGDIQRQLKNSNPGKS